MRYLLLSLVAAFLLTGCPEDKGGDKPAAGKDPGAEKGAADKGAAADKKEEKKDEKKKEEGGGW